MKFYLCAETGSLAAERSDRIWKIKISKIHKNNNFVDTA
jgi:hypothetical protein